MQYNALGGTGLLVSRLSFGAMTFTHDPSFHRSGLAKGIYKTTGSDAERLVGRALDAGVNYFDTADIYAQGQSEEILGRALKGHRDSVVISTKAGLPAGSAKIHGGLTRRHLHWSVDASLKRLGTDWIDVYIVHLEDRLTPLEEQLFALDDIVRAGKVRYIGFSNWSSWRVAAALEFQKAHGLARFCHGQMYYSLVGRDIEPQFVPLVKQYGIGLTIWSPLAGGFLTGKYSRDTPLPADGRLMDFDLLDFNNEQMFSALDIVRAVSARRKLSIAQISIAWLLSKPYVSSVILGASKMSQLEDNLGAADLILDSADLTALDGAMPPAKQYPEWMVAHQAAAMQRALGRSAG